MINVHFDKDLDIKSLQRIPSARVPLIKLTLNSGLEFDIVFASIPGMNKITEENDGQNIGGLVRKMADQIKMRMDNCSIENQSELDKMHQMFRSLAGAFYFSNLIKFIHFRLSF